MIPLVFAPGLLCDAAAFAAQTRALGGQVADYGAADTIPAMAEAILAQAAERFALVGHSMGGRAALEVARQAPERLLGLALMDTGFAARAPGDAGEMEKAGRLALVAKARTEGMRAMGAQWARPMVHPSRLDPADPLMDEILDMIGRKTPEVFAGQQQALIHRPDATGLLPGIACPTLVLCGVEDAWSPPAQHRALAAAIPDAVLVEIPDCGHMAPMERPQAVTAALRSWLDRVGSALTPEQNSAA